MSEMKSAFERAWERASRLEVKDEKIAELQYFPEGERLAAQFIKEDDFDLLAALDRLSGEARKYALKGALQVLLSNINLPRTERHRQDTKRALEGLKKIKRDKSLLSQLIGRLESLFAYYDRERQSYYESLRAEFERTIRQAMEQQGIRVSAQIHVERYPEFQQKWQEFSAQLDRAYEERLNILKAELERVN